MNPRYPFGVYTISNRARSASYATSPSRCYLSSPVIILQETQFVKRKFPFFGDLPAIQAGTESGRPSARTNAPSRILRGGHKAANGAYRYIPLALPLGELSPKVTERAFPLSVFAALSHLSQRERQGGGSIIPLRLNSGASPSQNTNRTSSI